MAITLTSSWMTTRRDRPLLVLGPSVGSSCVQLWSTCVDHLADRFSVLAWDLPGHAGAPVQGRFTIEDLAEAVLELVDSATAPAAVHPLEDVSRFRCAGDSLGAAVGLQLMLTAPQRIEAAMLVSTGARIGEPSAWHDRAALVRAEGIDAVVAGTIQRWFSRRTRADRPELVEDLVATLRSVDGEGYALACEALAAFDVRSRLAEIERPVLAVAGVEDVPTPVASLREIAEGVQHGTLVVLEDVAHLPPAEDPETVAALLVEHLG